MGLWQRYSTDPISTIGSLNGFLSTSARHWPRFSHRAAPVLVCCTTLPALETGASQTRVGMEWMGWYTTGYSGGGGHGGGGGSLPPVVRARQAEGHPGVAVYRRPDEPTPFAEVPNGEELRVLGGSPGHEGWLRVHSTRMGVQGWAKQRNLIRPQQPRALPAAVQARQADGHPAVAIYRRPGEPTPSQRYQMEKSCKFSATLPDTKDG